MSDDARTRTPDDEGPPTPSRTRPFARPGTEPAQPPASGSPASNESPLRSPFAAPASARRPYEPAAPSGRPLDASAADSQAGRAAPPNEIAPTANLAYDAGDADSRLHRDPNGPGPAGPGTPSRPGDDADTTWPAKVIPPPSATPPGQLAAVRAAELLDSIAGRLRAGKIALSSGRPPAGEAEALAIVLVAILQHAPASNVEAAPPLPDAGREL